MYGQICDSCEERRATIAVNVLRVQTEEGANIPESSSRDEDWCLECVRHHLDYWDKTEPKVGDTWTSNGQWLQGKRRGTCKTTYTIEEVPHKPAQAWHPTTDNARQEAS